MKIELKQLNVNMAEQEYEMFQGILDIENGFTNPAYNLSYKKYKKWLQEVDNHSQGIDLPKGWIPYTTYILYVDNVPVGYGRVRHSSSEYLETVVGAGNLGYGISKEYRGKGLMIGMELNDGYAGLRDRLLFERHFFTGAAGAQVIRLLPSLTVSQETAESFFNAWKELTL